MVTSGNTFSNFIKYVSRIPGGAGIIGIQPPSPDLYATIQQSTRGTGQLDLKSYIRALHSGALNLHAMWRVAESGYSNLDASISGFYKDDIYAFIRPTISASKDLYGIIEPVPGVDIYGTIQGFITLDLPATVIPVPPINLNGTISGTAYLDLSAVVSGYMFTDLSATASGYYSDRLSGIIRGEGSSYFDLGAQIRSILGAEVPYSLSGYITTANSGSSTISGNIFGYWFRDLPAQISVLNFNEISSSVTGAVTPDFLQATVTGTGSFADLYVKIKSLFTNSFNLVSEVVGENVLNLLGSINTDTGSSIDANISATGINFSDLNSNISVASYFALSGIYENDIDGQLQGSILSRPPSDLHANIRPKVFYIDSSIPINTYAFDSLRVIINEDCSKVSQFSDLNVSVSAINENSIQASYIGLAGQYAFSADELKIFAKQKVKIENWMFLIADQPVFKENILQLIATNHPLKNLQATIEAIPESSVLSGSINPVYISSVKRDATPIGEWVNPKTGERKLIKLFFRGSLSNFYYSSDSSNTFFENSDDFLELVVESYKIDENNRNSLLAIKQESKQAVVKNLSSFTDIDSAIKYAIALSVQEVNSSLSAEINAIGNTNDLAGNISGPTDPSQSIQAEIIPTENLPNLGATVSGLGSYFDLSSTVDSDFASITATPFFDIYGNRFMPTISIQENGDYSVVLTPVSPSGTIPIVSPDLYASISGSSMLELFTTVSGL